MSTDDISQHQHTVSGSGGYPNIGKQEGVPAKAEGGFFKTVVKITMVAAAAIAYAGASAGNATGTGGSQIALRNTGLQQLPANSLSSSTLNNLHIHQTSRDAIPSGSNSSLYFTQKQLDQVVGSVQPPRNLPAKTTWADHAQAMFKERSEGKTFINACDDPEGVCGHLLPDELKLDRVEMPQFEGNFAKETQENFFASLKEAGYEIAKDTTVPTEKLNPMQRNIGTEILKMNIDRNRDSSNRACVVIEVMAKGKKEYLVLDGHHGAFTTKLLNKIRGETGKEPLKQAVTIIRKSKDAGGPLRIEDAAAILKALKKFPGVTTGMPLVSTEKLKGTAAAGSLPGQVEDKQAMPPLEFDAAAEGKKLKANIEEEKSVVLKKLSQTGGTAKSAAKSETPVQQTKKEYELEQKATNPDYIGPDLCKLYELVKKEITPVLGYWVGKDSTENIKLETFAKVFKKGSGIASAPDKESAQGQLEAIKEACKLIEKGIKGAKNKNLDKVRGDLERIKARIQDAETYIRKRVF